MPMSSMICLASVPLLVPAGPPLHLQKDNLYLGYPYLGNRCKSPSLSWSPCTSHKAALDRELFFRLYINSLYLTFSLPRPRLSTRSPCTSHRATPGGDRLMVSKRDGPRLLPQPPPIEVIAGNDVKDNYCK